MEIWSRRGVREFDPRLEHLEKVLEQFRVLERLVELRRDRLFEAAVAALEAKVTLVEGDARSVSFRFSLDGRRHHRGSGYVLSSEGYLFKPYDGKVVRDEYGLYPVPEEPMTEVAPLAELTPQGLLDGINLLAVQEVLSL